VLDERSMMATKLSQKSQKVSRKVARTLATTVVGAGLAFVLASGCSRSEAAPNPARDEAPSSVGAKAKYETDQYVVEIKPAAGAKAGKEASFDVTIASKGGYHMNDKYPTKFTPVDPAPADVKWSKAVLKKEDGKFDDKKGSFAVGFTAAKAAKYKLGGKLSFSVCSDANCIMEKLDLEVDVEVK
jgi:hypothetical protein